MSTLLFLTTFLLVGVCLRASGSLRDLLASSQISNRDPESPLASLRPLRSTLFSAPSTVSTPTTSSDPSNPSVSVRACPCSSVPPPAAASPIPNPESAIPNPLCLLPEPLADALDVLTAELRHRIALYRYLDPASASAARRARRDARFAVRLRAIYATIAHVFRVNPSARPVDPTDFLPSLTATELARSEKYLGELTRAWCLDEAHPTAAEFDHALKALSRITALRRSLFEVDRLGPRPDAFPGWDADRHINPFDETFEPVFPDGVDRPSFLPPDAPLTPTQLIDRLLAPPPTPSEPSAPLPSSEPRASHRSCTSHRSHSSSYPSYPSYRSYGFPPAPKAHHGVAAGETGRRPLTLACVPGWLLRLTRRCPWLLYLRPRYLNPVIRKLALLAGLIVLYFPPPDAPPVKMSEADVAWWKAEEQRRIRIVHRPEIEGRQRGLLPTSLPPWGVR